jgi:membrane-associated protease RseP (regulator of RpoE activity)
MVNRPRSNILKIGIITAILIFAFTFWMLCSKVPESPVGPVDTIGSTTLTAANPSIQKVMAVQEQYTADLMSNPDVVGTAVGLTADDKPAILVLTARDMTIDKFDSKSLKKMAAASVLPTSIDGLPVVVMNTGRIYAMGKPTPVSHTAKQTPPIKLGTSGGFADDLDNGYCCGGTLGSLVKKGTTLYILSNYHVFYGDIADATAGKDVIQPGLIDVNCTKNNAQVVAKLEGTRSLPNSNVDAGLAQIVSGMVNTNGEILEIGQLSATTIAASLKQAVKKSGRTTRLTTSTVSGLNGTVSVQYEQNCAGAPAFTKTFTGQILVTNRGSKFLNSGDSGSLMVQNVTTNPKAIGLLFAGSSSIAVANPINEVLNFFGATMVGK